MPTQHDRTVPPTSGSPQRGLAATTFAALRRHRGTLAGAAVRIVGLCGLVGLLMTAAVFALAWPCFTRMRNQRIWYQQIEDPYLHDHTDLTRVALGALPFFLLLLCIGSAALQRVLAGGRSGLSRALERRRGVGGGVPRDCDRCSPCTRCAA
ncbi:hypothetical protein ACH4JZ_27050 [Streptomyces sp. NPDC017615]|uniref:hypothetical protein n=1 Tax=Streptomyces sp. NPDC017615 TaxID=3365003 RepID=UPI0037ADE073